MLRLSGTVGSHTLTENEMPSHTHEKGMNTTQTNAEYGNNLHLGRINIPTGSTGGSQSHVHDFTGSTTNGNSLPPYYTLAIIMRCA